MTWLKDFIKKNFIAGFILLVPIGATFTLFRYIIDKSDAFWAILPPAARPSTYLGFEIPGLGLLMAFVLVVFIGFLGRVYVIKFFIGLGERLIKRIPLISGVYSAIKQLLDTMFAGQSGKDSRKVVMFEYPRKGIWSIAFMTSTSRGETQEKTNVQTVNLFVPTTPNPTSGFLIIVPKDDVIHLDMSVEEAFKLIVSGGIVTPPSRKAASDDQSKIGN